MNTEVKVGKKRIDYLDVARGIAMICIVMGHVGSNRINNFVFTFHVPIFFLLTGYFINNSKSTIKFIGQKARTLLVPYAIACVVMILIAALQGIKTGTVAEAVREWGFASLYGSGSFHYEPFYIKQLGAIWFLLATFWGSIFLRISLNFKKWIRPIFIALLFAFGYLTATRLFWFPLSIQAGACATAFMYVGYLVKENWETIAKTAVPVRVLALLFALYVWTRFILEFSSFWFVDCNFGRGFLDIFGSLCGCACVLFIAWIISKEIPFLSKFLKFIGQYSLLFLCIHIVEQNFIRWDHIAIRFTENYTLTIIIYIVGKLTLDITLTFLLSRIKPFMRLLGYKA